MTELPEPTYDPETLHEWYPDLVVARASAEQLRKDVRDAPNAIAELVWRGDLVDLLRGMGALDEALDEANAAVARAEMVGTRPQQHTARVRLAQVHQWRGEFADSNLLFIELTAMATRFGPVIEAYTDQHAGENGYDQGHWDDAQGHFARALALRDELVLPVAQREASRIALAAAERRLEES
jgi:hypothetical protein